MTDTQVRELFDAYRAAFNALDAGAVSELFDRDGAPQVASVLAYSEARALAARGTSDR